MRTSRFHDWDEHCYARPASELPPFVELVLAVFDKTGRFIRKARRYLRER